RKQTTRQLCPAHCNNHGRRACLPSRAATPRCPAWSGGRRGSKEKFLRNRCHRRFDSAARFFQRGAGLIASNRRYVLIGENSRATYQCDMRECLREIAKLTLVTWIVFFREQPEIVTKIEQAFE